MHQPSAQHLIWNEVQGWHTHTHTHSSYFTCTCHVFLSSLPWDLSWPPTSTVTPTLARQDQTSPAEGRVLPLGDWPNLYIHNFSAALPSSLHFLTFWTHQFCVSTICAGMSCRRCQLCFFCVVVPTTYGSEPQLCVRAAGLCCTCYSTHHTFEYSHKVFFIISGPGYKPVFSAAWHFISYRNAQTTITFVSRNVFFLAEHSSTQLSHPHARTHKHQTNDRNQVTHQIVGGSDPSTSR